MGEAICWFLGFSIENSMVLEDLQMINEIFGSFPSLNVGKFLSEVVRRYSDAVFF